MNINDMTIEDLDGRRFTATTLSGATITSTLTRTGQNKLKDADALALVVYRRRTGEVRLNTSLFTGIRLL